MITKIENAIGPLDGKVVGVLGLTFKPNTSDVRESPALDIVQALLRKGAQIRAYDPAGMDEFQKVVNDEKISYWGNAYEAARGAEALVFLTEWNEFRNLDLRKLKEALSKPVVLDLRNIYEPERVTDLGFRYMGVGRGTTV
jgi:UDPglucose 6-dehydrogenase